MATKPFKVTYAPDNWNAPNGGLASAWTTPYGGLNVQAPKNQIGPQFTPAMNNFTLRNAAITSRPRFRQLFGTPDQSNLILACGSFLSNNSVYHTFCMTPRGLFQLKTNALVEQARGRTPWQFLGSPSLGSSPVAWQAYAGILYYTNGRHLSAWDGAVNKPIADVAFTGATNPPIAGQTTFGSVFLGELDSHLLMAYTAETLNGKTTVFPTRLRWSNNGFNPTLNGSFGANLGTIGATFDPAINVNAGFNDFLDCPDILTGLMTIGRVGYLFRQNGITELTVTGKGVLPFDFNHLWASQNGVGNVYPFSIAQYGNMGIFISFEQIYQISPGALNPIGGGARDAIMADLAIATGTPKASLDRGFTLGYTYLNYHLRIPQDGGTRSYLWCQETGSWESWMTTGVTPTGIQNECWV